MVFIAKNGLNPPLPLLHPPATSLQHSEPALQDVAAKRLGQKPAELAQGGPAWLEYRSPGSEHHPYGQAGRCKNGLHRPVTAGGFRLPSSPRCIFFADWFLSLPPCPHALSTCSSSTAALTRRMRFMVLQVKWQGSQEESRRSSRSGKAARRVYRNCTGSRIKRGE